MDSLNILRGVLMFCHKSLNVLRFPKRHIYQSQNMEICLKENSEEISRVNLKTYINSARVYGFRAIFPPKADGWMAGDTPR